MPVEVSVKDGSYRIMYTYRGITLFLAELGRGFFIQRHNSSSILANKPNSLKTNYTDGQLKGILRKAHIQQCLEVIRSSRGD